jgi:hypothetical protein
MDRAGFCRAGLFLIQPGWMEAEQLRRPIIGLLNSVRGPSLLSKHAPVHGIFVAFMGLDGYWFSIEEQKQSSQKYS